MMNIKPWMAMFTTLSLLSMTPSLIANPENPTVVLGDVSFDSSVNNVLTVTVNDNTARSIVDWETFSINPGQTTEFILPDSSSAILNRVTSPFVSDILGNLTSNGQVYLINPNGIIVNTDAVIDTMGFLASTLDVSNQAFIDGEFSPMTFSGPANDNVFTINYGTIETSDGDVILLGYQMITAGEISADGDGQVGLAVGTEIIYQPNDQPRIVINPQSYPKTEPQGIDHVGVISALQTEIRADGNAYKLAINHEGMISALPSDFQEGKIFVGTVDGTTKIDGTSAAGGLNDSGGYIEFTGTDILVTNNSITYASGQAGGGSIFIGGGFQGDDPAIPNAETVVVQDTALIEADALFSGDGGLVVAWADDTMDFAGDIFARGGDSSGNGGIVEISGVNDLSYSGSTDVTAPNGEDGFVIFDPIEFSFEPKTELTADPILN